MTLIDSEGRVFGRINLVDAAVAVLAVGLLPLALGAALLFRAPAPVISSVEMAPLTITEDRAAQGTVLGGKLKVRGTGLRPVLRAQIGEQPAIGFIFETPSSADVLFGDIPGGTHDLVLFDGRQEVARASGAVTIPAKPAPAATRVRLAGRYVDLGDAAARDLRVGATFLEGGAPSAEILALGDVEAARVTINATTDVAVPDRWQRTAVMAVRCQLPLMTPRECRVGGVLLDISNVLPVPGTAGALRFLIDTVLPDHDPARAELRVRFAAYPSVVNLMAVGDRDREERGIDGRGAVIASLGTPRLVSGEVAFDVIDPAARLASVLQATDELAVVDAVLHAGLDDSRAGWRYRGEAVRAGGSLTFTTRSYRVRGVVTAIAIPPVRGTPNTGASR
jgi:hypothetical protein